MYGSRHQPHYTHVLLDDSLHFDHDAIHFTVKTLIRHLNSLVNHHPSWSVRQADRIASRMRKTVMYHSTLR